MLGSGERDDGYHPYASLLMTGVGHPRGFDYQFAQPAMQPSYVIKGQDTDIFMKATAQNRGKGFKRVRFDQQIVSENSPLVSAPSAKVANAKICIAPEDMMAHEQKHAAVHEGRRLKNRILKQLAEEGH